MYRKKIIYPIIIISNVFFLLLYFVLCLNNRPAIDDFHFISNVNEYGLFEGTIVEYNLWNSRWASVFLNHLVLLLYQKSPFSLLLFGLFNLVLFASTIFLLLKNTLLLVNQHYFVTLKEKSKSEFYFILINISVFLVSLIFISTIRIDETWFWVCSSTTYLWSNILLLLGFSCLINKKKNRIIGVLGALSFFYVGGSSGPLAIVTMLVLLVVSMVLIFKSISLNFDKNLIIKRSLAGFVFCLASFIILYVAPGNGVREQFFEKVGIGYSLVLNVKMVGIILLKRLPLTLIFIVVLCLPVISLGNYFREENTKFNWKKNIYATLIYFSLIYVFQLSITYKTQDIGAFRALFFITIITVFYFLRCYYLVGKSLKLNKFVKQYLVIIPLIVSSFIFGYEFINQKVTTSKYATAYDERMEYINENKENEKSLELIPLPGSGMLYSAELSSDTSYFSNQQFKKGLNLKFNVRKQP